ncbi:hypothetical protein K7X08_037541 [Anisodus acutangulus]|uniref:Protein kinase domain-containing protein n=1 Tax=Anisodus acutangulus TaxID=402998 RepID=A0A9Q1RSC2_9SOLA|nr:hypothetical protein K7X08_037541 [Anisodus acutangulus]
MEKDIGLKVLLVLHTLLLSICLSEQLQSSQENTLLRIQNLLNYPNALSNWNNDTDFCNTEPSSTVTVICYEESITQLHKIGEKRASQLPKYFSIDLFVTTLVKLPSLKVLRLVSLGLWGPLPSKLSRLSSLEILDLSSNFFHSDIPRELSSLTSLQTLILDGNKFTGRLPNGLGNKLTGMLFEDTQCNAGLDFVDLSTNLLSGRLPSCLLSGPKQRVLCFTNNCLATGDRTQHPFSFCRNEALAVGILPKQNSSSKVALGLIICGSIIGGVVLVCATIIVVRKFLAKIAAPNKTTRSIVENASSTYTSKLFTDAKYVTRAMKLGSLNLPSYRTFSSEELKVATNNFDAANFIGNSSDDQVINKNFMHHIEMMSKLRHHHLVSTLGHCFELARGIQFLHTGIVPGIFSNNIKITDIMLDQNLVAKICSYNLLILAENVKENFQNLSKGSKELKNARANYEEKMDVFDFGLQESIMANAVSRRNVADPAIRDSCSDESLKTMIEICCRCLLQDTEDRPSVEDVIWNLQFAAQVEDSWRKDSSSSDASPISHLYNLKPNLSRNSNSSSG